MDDQSLTFEQALARLEVIVDCMENGETTLEQSITLYKEGVALSARCNAILGKFEAEVIQLQKEADGTYTELPFDTAVKE